MTNNKNPKYVEALKRGKIDYSTVPWPAVIGLAEAMVEGTAKYGRFNYRQDAIEARTYVAAILRHLLGDPSTGSVGWVNGEDIDAESGLHHLHKVMACCALVIDAQQHGKLIDNRLETESKQPPSVARERVDRLAPVAHTPTMEEIIDLEKAAASFVGAEVEGPWDAVFTVFHVDGTRVSEQRRGPYQSQEQAIDYSERNPERIPGFRHVSLSQKTIA